MIDHAIFSIDAELSKVGLNSVYAAQLNIIRKSILDMKENVLMGIVLPSDNSLSRVVIDSWAFDNPLGAVILNLEREYKKH